MIDPSEALPEINGFSINISHIVMESLENFSPAQKGETILEMQLSRHGNDYTGNSYFCRGGDLYDKEFIGPDFGYYDTEFANEGHERYGPWDYVVYYLEAEIGSESGGELILRDHESTAILVETFSPGNSKNELGTVMGTSGNWTLEISLSGDADVRIRIAGAIEYSYAV